MRFFNTLGRRLEEFRPLKDGEAKLYTCGPTVYDYAHIGNLRSFIFDDTLRRALELSNLKVRHVMNITDVGHLASDMDEGEDKLEAGADREGKSVWQIAERYTKAFMTDVEALNILSPNSYKGPAGAYARATDFIDEQIVLVRILLDKGYAYQTEQAIYFDISKLPSYGELTGQKLAEKEVGARVQVVTDDNKRHPQDFGLWFFTVGRFANHTMRWDSPWGAGFPGWHLECSAIIHKTLDDPIDIHTGGVDHIGTHHPNEMAQSEAAFGHKLANYWLHNEFVLVDGQKMAKSLGNFLTLKDITERGYDPLALRLLFLQAHYRSQLNFTWESMDGAQNLLNKFYSWSDLQFQAFRSPDLETNYRLAFKKIVAAMDNDLMTPEALGWFNGMVNRVGSLGIDSESIREYAKKVDGYFGLGLSAREDIAQNIRKLIDERESARRAEDWAKADALRRQIDEQGIGIDDTPRGPVWSRK